ncbi:MAG TPA: ATPase, T2SS/T4P/T4SS family, partial [Myxococcaceae bacterium]
MARLDPIFERLLREGTELLFDSGSPAVMRTGAGDVPVLRQLLTAQQIAGIFSEVVPSEMRAAFPAPGLTTFEYGAPAGRVAVRFERNGGQVRAIVRPADRRAEEEGEAIELASAAEMLHEYMHGPPGALNPGKAPTPAATGIPTGSQPGIPMGSQAGARCGQVKDVQFRELPGQGKGGGRPEAAPAGKPAAPTAAPEPAGKASSTGPALSLAADPRGAMDQLLNYMLDKKASDLHVSSDTTPILRVDGDMTPIEGHPPLSASRLKDMLFSIAPEKNREQWLSIKDTDFAYELPRARFRVNVFEDRKGIGSVMRQIPNTIRTAQEMGLPQAVLDLCFLNKGLVVVTGPTGSGKSTTLA